ncbi:DUF5132 domain-containing protein [Acidisphaera sp. S103]|uniref:DUF5132 domain-containing protein n=1 Tax=Acidisphaera sp. S103 TaxID=1747223 RepID=UPI00131B0895|nr:DUF5132 domain-containing protein [Acidisphaera sp. S103]
MSDETHSTPDDSAKPSPEAPRSGWACDDFSTKAATVGVIVVGAALIEAALIPGMIVGAAAILAPKYVPKMGSTLQPMFRSVVRGAYKFGRKAREAAAEAKEQVQDIVAEVHAEGSDTSGTPAA